MKLRLRQNGRFLLKTCIKKGQIRLLEEIFCPLIDLCLSLMKERLGLTGMSKESYTTLDERSACS